MCPPKMSNAYLFLYLRDSNDPVAIADSALPIAGGVDFPERGLFGAYPVSPPCLLSRLSVCKLLERQSACVAGNWRAILEMAQGLPASSRESKPADAPKNRRGTGSKKRQKKAAAAKKRAKSTAPLF